MSKTKDTIDYTALCPKEPPAGMEEFLISKGFLSSQFIIYRAGWSADPITGIKEKAVDCHCTACKRDYQLQYAAGPSCHMHAPAPFGFYMPETLEPIISGDSTLCPLCGAGVKAIHIGNFGRDGDFVAARGYPMSIHITDGKLIMATWLYSRVLGKDGSDRIEVKKYEAYIYAGRKCVKCVGYKKEFCNTLFYPDWQQRTRCFDSYGVPDAVYPFDEDMLVGTQFENCKLGMYLKQKEPYPITYMRIYIHHPNIENLIMQGQAKLVSEMIADTKNSYYSPSWSADIKFINFKAKRPSEMLGLNKEEFAVFKSRKWTLNDLKIYVSMKSLSEPFGYEDFELVRKNFGLYTVNAYNDLRYRPASATFMKICRYILKQKRKYPYDNAAFGILADYWRLASELGDPLETADDIFPQRLKSKHDDAAKRFEKQKKKIGAARFKKRASYLEQFICSDGILTVVIPKSENDLRKEGRELSHCVGTYAERHASGQTNILFVRKVGEEDKPYYTMEFDIKNQRIVQDHGKSNKLQTPDVIAFEKVFLIHAAEILRKRAEKV